MPTEMASGRQNGGPLREVAWQDIFPWLLLVRTFRISIQVWQLLLGASGVFLTIVGWWLLAWVFHGTAEQPLKEWLGPSYYQSCPWKEREGAWPWQSAGAVPMSAVPADALPVGEPSQLAGQQEAGAGYFPVWRSGPPQLGRYPSDPFLSVWAQLRAPFRQLFDERIGITGLAFLLCSCLWAAAVWALFGGAITRRAALQFGREENIGLQASLRYVRGKWGSYFLAPLLPLVGVFICACPVLFLGLLMWLDVGVLLAALVWPLALLASLLMALLLMAMLFGWPLMWPTISTEGTDSFDALSRSWSYVYHRPLHYLFYAMVVTVLGSLGWLLVTYFADWVAYLPLWAASWTAGGQRMEEILSGADSLNFMGRWGSNVIHFWGGCVRLLAIGFAYSYFWTASTGIYFLLRRDDDGTDLDDVHLEPADQTYGLPPLERDAAGVPVVSDSEPAAPENDESQPTDQEGMTPSPSGRGPG
ncbi:MAG TPA: hypothetical protein VG826_30850 [Pirellulales bacterium]|nr:hypothetical protein [Pirellulales bacterium]